MPNSYDQALGQIKQTKFTKLSKLTAAFKSSKLGKLRQGLNLVLSGLLISLSILVVAKGLSNFIEPTYVAAATNSATTLATHATTLTTHATTLTTNAELAQTASHTIAVTNPEVTPVATSQISDQAALSSTVPESTTLETLSQAEIDKESATLDAGKEVVQYLVTGYLLNMQGIHIACGLLFLALTLVFLYRRKLGWRSLLLGFGTGFLVMNLAAFLTQMLVANLIDPFTIQFISSLVSALAEVLLVTVVLSYLINKRVVVSLDTARLFGAGFIVFNLLSQAFFTNNSVTALKLLLNYAKEPSKLASIPKPAALNIIEALRHVQSVPASWAWLELITVLMSVVYLLCLVHFGYAWLKHWQARYTFALVVLYRTIMLLSTWVLSVWGWQPFNNVIKYLMVLAFACYIYLVFKKHSAEPKSALTNNFQA